MDIKLHAPRDMVSLGWSSRLGGGGGGGSEGGEDEGVPPGSFFQLYGNGGDTAGGSGGNQVTAATYTRGFELWQQQQQYSLYPPSSGLLNFGDAAVGARGSSRRGGSGGDIEFGTRGRGSGGGGVSCQDCGNQSKKDCVHMRCRTCCKSRGFHCPTHVKSTWIPASKRRERQQLASVAAALQQQSQHSAGSGGGGGGEPSKRPREITTRLPTTITTTSSANGGTDAPGFPAEVSSPVVFRCVRVSPLDEADDEMAYQTEVSIQGHVFKGILYDHGPDAQRTGESSSSSAATAFLTTTAAPAISTNLSAAVAPAVHVAAGTAGLLDTTSLYPPQLAAFMAGTQFFPQHQRP